MRRRGLLFSSLSLLFIVVIFTFVVFVSWLTIHRLGGVPRQSALTNPLTCSLTHHYLSLSLALTLTHSQSMSIHPDDIHKLWPVVVHVDINGVLFGPDTANVPTT